MSPVERLAAAIDRLAAAIEGNTRQRVSQRITDYFDVEAYEGCEDEPPPTPPDPPELAGLLHLGIRPDLARSLAECGVTREHFAPRGGRRTK